MNAREEGFLLLTGHLGDPRRRPLTVSQLRELERCVLRSSKQTVDRELSTKDLIALGCQESTAEKVVSLLLDQPLLHEYLRQGYAADCVPLSRVTDRYPLRMRKCLGLDAPGCIWLKGDAQLLTKPAVALVGSRDLLPENEAFARQVGMMAAKYGFVLISGNARGADSVAQESCLQAGGNVISVVADSLRSKRLEDRILYISEEGFDLTFTNQRALSRNRLIHTMASAVFVAQCSNGTGGTWDGTKRNLRDGWGRVYCFADGSLASMKLYKMGATMKRTQEIDETMAELVCNAV